MPRSTITYDHIRTRSIQGINGNLHIDDIDDGILIVDNTMIQSISLPIDNILIGTANGVDYISPKGTDSTIVDINIEKRELTFSLNPAREEHLSYVPSPISDTYHPYSILLVEGTGDTIAILDLTPWTSYCIIAESISDIGNSFARIHSEWLIRYTDIIEIKQVNGYTHTLGDDIKPIISLISQSNSVILKSTINTMWTSKLSIMRTRTLNIV